MQLYLQNKMSIILLKIGLTAFLEVLLVRDVSTGNHSHAGSWFWNSFLSVCWGNPGQGPVSRKSRWLYGPEIKYSNRNIKNKSAGPGKQTTLFCFINWQFYHVRCKTIETSIFNVNGDSLPGPLIIGTFEKQAPEALVLKTVPWPGQAKWD